MVYGILCISEDHQVISTGEVRVVQRQNDGSLVLSIVKSRREDICIIVRRKDNFML